MKQSMNVNVKKGMEEFPEDAKFVWNHFFCTISLVWHVQLIVMLIVPSHNVYVKVDINLEITIVFQNVLNLNFTTQQ